MQYFNYVGIDMAKASFFACLAEGKPYRVALVATMRKMVHVIHAIWTRETPFQNKIPALK